MPQTPASSLVYPFGSDTQPPHVHYGALAESADPRLIGITDSMADVADMTGDRWKGTLTWSKAEQRHYIQTGRPNQNFGYVNTGSDGWLSLADGVLSSLVTPSNDEAFLGDYPPTMHMRVLSRERPIAGSYRPTGNLEDPVTVNTFKIKVPEHPLSESGKWLLMAGIAAKVWNVNWDRPPPKPDENNASKFQATTHLEMRIAEKENAEPRRVVYLAGPPDSYFRQSTSHTGVLAVEGDQTLDCDIRAFRLPEGTIRDFNIANAQGQCQGYVLAMPIRL